MSETSSEMQQASLTEEYCIDSCCLIDFWADPAEQRPYSKDAFPAHWNHIEKCIGSGRIISARAVYDELENTKNDDFKKWLSSRRSIFVPLDADQVAIVRQIVTKYDAYTKGSPKADPILVALAKSRGLKVITSEKKRATPSPNMPDIPNLCEEFGVECVSIVQFSIDEGIK